MSAPIYNLACLGVRYSDIQGLPPLGALKVMCQGAARQAVQEAKGASHPDAIRHILIEAEKLASVHRKVERQTDAGDAVKRGRELQYHGALMALLLVLPGDLKSPVKLSRLVRAADPRAKRLLEVCYAWSQLDDLYQGLTFAADDANRPAPMPKFFEITGDHVGIQCDDCISSLLPSFDASLRCVLRGVGSDQFPENAMERVLSALANELDTDSTVVVLSLDPPHSKLPNHVAADGLKTISQRDWHAFMRDAQAEGLTSVERARAFVDRSTQNLRDASSEFHRFASSYADSGASLSHSIEAEFLMPFLLPVMPAGSNHVRFWTPDALGHDILMRSMFSRMSHRRPSRNRRSGKTFGQINRALTKNSYPWSVLRGLFGDLVDHEGCVETERYFAGVNEPKEIAGVSGGDFLEVDLYCFDRTRGLLSICELVYLYASRKFSYYRKDRKKFRPDGDEMTDLQARINWATRHCREFETPWPTERSREWKIQGLLVPSQFPSGHWYANRSLGCISLAGSLDLKLRVLGDETAIGTLQTSSSHLA